MLKRFKEDKEFYKRLFIITLPIVLQNLIASSLNMLDTMMIGVVGEIELASVGIANQYYFLFSLIVFGISSGSGVFIAQLWGKRDVKNIKKTLGIGLISGLIAAVLFSTIGLLFSKQIMGIFNTDPRVIETGSKYLVIVIVSYLFTAITFSYAAALRSIGNTVLPMIASFIGLVTNGALNYILIFGKLGLPAMGVKGAALATVTARIVECLIILIVVYSKNEILNAKIKEFINIEKYVLNGLYKVTIPIVLNEACWGLGSVTYVAIYGRIGTGAAASIQICSTVMNLFMIVTFGLANAAVVIVGNEIGANREEVGKIYAQRISKLAIMVSIILSLVLALSSKWILSIFNVSETVKLDSLYILYIYAAVLIVKVYNAVMIVGVLRGGGDSTFGSLVQVITLWCIGIPLAYIGAFIICLPVYLVVLLTFVEEAIKVVIMMKRFKSGKWIHNMVKDIGKEASI
ncbi:MATE family efflux transporter [Clostridium senegalense]|uniref:MATE family efflux transporter n=1 Tax=Clostridium senegalense TaxID=1465809 RepID=A0A6M0H4M3_9CLOT|nr:MATE family efflux transporter [Clostridium senegalense]NEU05467.1 MATE family efflux transporter [Clostridium senegalense]